MSDRPVTAFFKANPPREDAYFRSPAYTQRDFFERLEDLMHHIAKKAGGSCTARVIGDHMSKSVELPVVEYAFSNGASVVLRGNFYNYAVSVVSPQADVPRDWLRDISTDDEKIDAVYCEGFPDGKVYGPITKDARRFTMKMGERETLGYFMLSFARLQAAAMEQAATPAPAAAATAPKP